MKRDEALAIMNRKPGENSPQDMIAATIKPEHVVNFKVFLGRFESAGNSDDGWTPIAVNVTGLEVHSETHGTFHSDGGARVITEHRMGDAGFAFQSSDQGIWLWGAD